MATKQAVIVNDRDVFNYLKVCMYSDSINDLRRSGKKIRSGVFYETIRMLENVDSGLNKIEDNIISTEVAYLDSDYETQKEIIHFLNLLRLDEELIEFAKNIDTFLVLVWGCLSNWLGMISLSFISVITTGLDLIFL